MEFISWLLGQLNQRGWSQRDLARAARQAGYKLASGQLSYILSGTRQAGPEACIAIAAGLGVSREEVFRARGWLLEEPQQVIPPQATPDVIKLIRDLTSLDDDAQKRVTPIMQSQIDRVRHFVKEQRAPYGAES